MCRTLSLAFLILSVVCLPVRISRAGEIPADQQMDQCAKHLQAIGAALAAYERDHHTLPDQLSDLFPHYIKDKAIFHCPADETEGTPGRSFGHKDPKVPMSYSYEFSADDSHGLPAPLGPHPKPDRSGGGWGSDRLLNTWLGQYWGDRVPVVRCFHHKTEDSYENKVLNLTRGSRIYRARGVWEDHPESFAALLDQAEHDLADPRQFKAKWFLGPFEQYLWGKLDDDEYKSLRLRFAPFADRLAAMARDADPAHQRMAYRIAARFYNAAGQYHQAADAMKRSIHAASQIDDYAPDRYGSHIEQDVIVLMNAYNGLGDHEQALPLALLLHGYRPKVGLFMQDIAAAQEAMGQTAAAAQWRYEEDPARLLVGREAPDFQLFAPAGQHVWLKDLLKTRKAILVNFWFCGCGPCRAEAPGLQKLYSDLHDKGLEIIAIDLGDKNQDVEKFVAQDHLTFKVVMGGDHEEGAVDVFTAYHVQSFPSNFLVDHSGKIVWRNNGYSEEELAAVRTQLQKLGLQ